MFGVLVFFHATACLILIFIVLLQGGRGAELGAAFGGVGQAQGGRTPLTGIGKVTAVAAAIFMMTSLSLAFLSSERSQESVVKSVVTTLEPDSTQEEAKENKDTQPAEEEEPFNQPQMEQKDAPPIKE